MLTVMKAILRLTILIALPALCVATAGAQANRTFVSAQKGNDANVSTNCGAAAPCRTFAAAIGQTNGGGEVAVLDSGGYGPFIIRHSVRVEAPAGVYAGITVPSGGFGVTIEASILDTVVLKGLTLQSFNGLSGIFVQSVANLSVEDCIVDGFLEEGIRMTSLTTCSLMVKDTVVRNGQADGISVGNNSGLAAAVIDHCKFFGNPDAGVVAAPNAQVTVRDSVASGNGIGFEAFAGETQTLPGNSEMNIENCVAIANQDGILASTGYNNVTATIRVALTVISDNTDFGILESGIVGTPQILSFGNNRVSGNATAGVFTSAIALQ